MNRTAVFGLGLIGGSLAMAARARGYDRDESVRSAARARGIEVAETPEDAARGAEIVVIAVPTASTPLLLRELSAMAPGAVLTDTASIKAPLVLAARTLRSGIRYVGGHPMAGARSSGVAAANASLFSGRPWILVPTARSDGDAIAAVSSLVRSVGARPVVLDGDRHDRLMTWVSHLPQAVAASLARAAAAHAGAELPQVAGPGLLETTRIADRRTELALELALADPEALVRAIDTVREELSRLSAALRGRNSEALGRFFAEAAAARRGLDGPTDPSRS